MSIQAMAWVLEESEATLAERLVLLAIANHADARGWNAWPAVPQIAREARVDPSTVYRVLELLERSGELVIKRRPGRSNIYGITALMGSQSERGEPVVEGSQIERGGGLRLRGVTPLKLRGDPSYPATTPLSNSDPNRPLTVKEPKTATHAPHTNGKTPPRGDNGFVPPPNFIDDLNELPERQVEPAPDPATRMRAIRTRRNPEIPR